MIDTPAREIRVDQVMRRLREQIQSRSASSGSGANGGSSGGRVEERGAHPEAGVEIPALPRPPRLTALESKSRFALRDFLDHHDESFVRNAYLGILGREPDAEGWAHFLTALRDGSLSKIEILGRLRYSKEGRLRSTPVAGLLLPFLANAAYRTPVLGTLFRFPVALLRLPKSAGQSARLEAYVNHRFSDLGQLVDEGFGRIEAGMRDLDRGHAARLEALRAQAAERRRIEALSGEVSALGEAKADAGRVEGLAAELGRLSGTTAAREQVEGLARSLDELAQRKADAEGLQEIAVRLGEVSRRLDKFAWRKADAESLQELVVRAGALSAQLDALSQEKADVGALRRVEEEHRSELEALRRGHEERTREESASVKQWISGIDEQMRGYRLALLEEQRRLAFLLREARKRMPKPLAPAQLEVMVSEEEHLQDAMYSSLEDRFRGTREEIAQRLSVYLPRVAEVRRRTRGGPVLDLGCGRGEWLELMKREGWAARGVDCNRVMIQRCAEAGLEAEEADALDFLRRQKASTFGVITAFHVLEHLPFAKVLALLDEARRTLRRGGLVIFETPNPENLVVGACNFYADPTHRNPLFPPTLEFVLEERGFVQVEILRPNQPSDPDWMQPLEADEPLAARINPILAALRSWFNAPPEFTATGRKA